MPGSTIHLHAVDVESKQLLLDAEFASDVQRLRDVDKVHVQGNLSDWPVGPPCLQLDLLHVIADQAVFEGRRHATGVSDLPFVGTLGEVRVLRAV